MVTQFFEKLFFLKNILKKAINIGKNVDERFLRRMPTVLRSKYQFVSYIFKILKTTKILNSNYFHCDAKSYDFIYSTYLKTRILR